jgi:small redox-active disulfide protein 2
VIRERLAKRNYFAPGSEPLYEEAFLREYQKHLGLPVTDNSGAELTVKVIGPGCPRCERLRDDVLQILSEADLPADFEYVSDLQEVAEYGLFALPALIINGRVKTAGRVPSRSDLQNWLKAKDGQGGS